MGRCAVARSSPPGRAVEALTAHVLPAAVPAAVPAAEATPTPVLPSVAPAAGVARCAHGLLATEPCAVCGRRRDAGGEIVGGMIEAAPR